MPFTFSHPALVLPLTRLSKRWVSATGLVAGSIIPDFEKFLKMNDGNTYSHTLPGIFWFDLPLAVLLSFVFHQVVRDPLIDNLPTFLRARCGPARSFNWVGHLGKHYPAVLFSLLLGIFSHLVWDYFTHRPAHAIPVKPPPYEGVSFSPYEALKLYYLPNLLSSVGGILFVMYFILKLPAQKIRFGRYRRIQEYWFFVCIMVFAITLLRIGLGPRLKHHFDFAIVIIAAGMAGLLMASFVFKIKNRLSNICNGEQAE
jgi:hypothetical protein